MHKVASALMPSAETSVMKGRDAPRPACASLRASGPATRTRARPGLGQRAGSGRIGLGQKCPAGKRRCERVVMDLRHEPCRSDTELGRKIDRGGAAQAVAAARKAVVVLMPVIG